MTNKEITRLLRRLRRQGFQVWRSRSGHWRVRGPEGTTTLPATPRNGRRSLENSRADLRRIGARL